MRKHHAFTIVEILIVLVICGILAVIVIPEFKNMLHERDEVLEEIRQTNMTGPHLFELRNRVTGNVEYSARVIEQPVLKITVGPDDSPRGSVRIVLTDGTQADVPMTSDQTSTWKCIAEDCHY